MHQVAGRVWKDDQVATARAGDDRPWQNPPPEVEAAWQEASGTRAAPAVAGPVDATPGRPSTQANWFGHLKSILAAIGVVAIAAQLLRVAR